MNKWTGLPMGTSEWTFSKPMETKHCTRFGVCLDGHGRVYEYVVEISKVCSGGTYYRFGYGHTPEEAIEAAHKKVIA